MGDSERPALRTEGYFLVKPDCLRVVPSLVAADDGERVRVGGGVLLLLAVLAWGARGGDGELAHVQPRGATASLRTALPASFLGAQR